MLSAVLFSVVMYLFSVIKHIFLLIFTCVGSHSDSHKRCSW